MVAQVGSKTGSGATSDRRAAQLERFAAIRRRIQVRYVLLALPATLFLLVFYGYPVVAMLLRSFNDPAWGFTNFEPLVTIRSQMEILGAEIPSNAYLRVMFNTVWLAFLVTVVTLVLGYPVAYLLAKLPVTRANVLMVLVLIPFWTSILVRSYAWMVLLGQAGIINDALLRLGLRSEQLSLLHTQLAVGIGMVHILLPFMILPLYTVMRGIDRTLLRAAENLGAAPAQVFRRVFFPLSIPGVGAGCSLVFILSLGFYITPALLGGQRDVTIAMLIFQQVNQLNWGVGSALALVLLLVALLVYRVFNRMLGVERLYGGVR